MENEFAGGDLRVGRVSELHVLGKHGFLHLGVVGGAENLLVEKSPRGRVPLPEPAPDQ